MRRRKSRVSANAGRMAVARLRSSPHSCPGRQHPELLNPPTTPCGSERAAFNIAPAIAPDGIIYTIAKAHLVTRYNYLVAVNSNMTGNGKPIPQTGSMTAAA